MVVHGGIVTKISNCNVLDSNSINGKSDFNKQENQRIILKEFRRIVQDILEPHHDDQFLLRWLKARDYNISKAEKMLRESLKFRKKYGINSLLTSAYQIPEAYMKHPSTASLGFDKDNSIVRIFMLGLCDFKGLVSSLSYVDRIQIIAYFLENDLKMMQERKKKVGNVDMKTTFVVDYQGISLKQFYDKAVINVFIQFLSVYQDNYPEILKTAYLVNVPSYFSWLYSMFKPFLNQVTLNKLKIYKTDEWQEELRNIMDPKLIPAFMGGELTAPDGNPKCTHLINWNPKIETSYYMTQNQTFSTTDPDMKTATVQQRGVLQIPVEVKTTGSVLKWTFRTKDYNIRFGLFLRRGENSSSLEEVIPVESVDCQVLPEKNQLTCEKTGTYVLHFDNSYSWLTTKQLYYKVEIGTVDVFKN